MDSTRIMDSTVDISELYKFVNICLGWKTANTLAINEAAFAMKPIFIIHLMELDELYHELMHQLRPGTISAEQESKLATVCAIVRKYIDDCDVKIDYTIRQQFKKPEMDSEDAKVDAETVLGRQSTGIHFSNPYMISNRLPL